MNHRKNSAMMIALAAGMICLLVYLRALTCDFVNWDDQDYVLNNVAIRTLDSHFLSWAFTTPYLGWWMPLTWISFALDYHFWNLNPLGYHLTNILLHTVNTSLVVLIADRLCRNNFTKTGAPSDDKYLYPAVLLLGGLLFGIHPLRVESVAWVTERKDVLNGFFSLGSIYFYLRYAQQNKRPGNKWTDHDYLVSFLLFLFSLMAKSVSVVIPLMLFVIDWHPLGRLRKGGILPVLAEKVPYLVLSAAMTSITLFLSFQGEILAMGLTIGQRFIISGNAVFEYCRLLLMPVGIIPLYVIPDPIPYSYILKGVVVGFASVAMYVLRRRKWIVASWLCFVIPLLPVLAFAQNGIQSFAARFTYLPSVSISIVAASGVAAAYRYTVEQPHRLLRTLVIGLAAALLIFYGAMTHRLIGVWKDSGTMWSRVIEYQPFDRAYFYRGLFLVDTGKYLAAVEDYTTCLTIATEEKLPDIYNLYAFRGEALAKAGRYEDAVKDFSTAIKRFPHPLYYYHRGMAWKGLGNVKEADEDLQKAGRAAGQMRWFSS